MKILHIIHKQQPRGAEVFTSQLANHQQKTGASVKIISVYSGEYSLSWAQEIICLEGSEKKTIDFKAWKKLAEFIEDFQPDIVQANSGDTLKYAVLSKVIFRWKKPIVFRNASEVGRYLKSGIQKRFNSFLYRNVKMIVSVSIASEKDLLYHFPFLKNKTKVIPVGLEDKTPKQLVLLPEFKKHIIHVGGFSFEKNHKGLISIFKKILELRPEIHLHLIGDGPIKLSIEELVREERIKENVTFYGYLGNPMEYIKAADVLVLPSIIEGLPGVLLEAMFCKTPVVAYDVGGISEIVTEKTGSLIPLADEENFAYAIVNSLKNKNYQKVENAYEMVINHFMNKTISKQFIEVYEQVLIGKG